MQQSNVYTGNVCTDSMITRFLFGLCSMLDDQMVKPWLISAGRSIVWDKKNNKSMAGNDSF